MTTELIASTKPVVATGKQFVIVTTASGATIWVAKEQFDTNADQIVYNTHKKGEEYTKRDDTKGVFATDRNEFVGMKKLNKLELLDYMAKLGISPSLS